MNHTTIILFNSISVSLAFMNASVMHQHHAIYRTNLKNNKPASKAMVAPKRKGALAPNPAHVPAPCQSRPAINEAGSAVMPMAAL
jgi:hypothetical protein